MRNFSIKALLAAIVFTMISLSSFSAFCWGLKSEVQSEIDKNPFLKKEEIKLRVIDEKDGYLTIEMYEGDRRIREKISKGKDIDAIEKEKVFSAFDENEERALSALKTVLNYLKSMKGVKAIMLSSATKTPHDQSEDLMIKASNLRKQKQYLEAANSYTKVIEIFNNYYKDTGWPGSLANIYLYRGDAYADNMEYDKAIKDYLKCTDLDSVNVNCNQRLCIYYAACKDPKLLDGKKAVLYGLKAHSAAPEKPFILSALAAAYARNSQFDKAIETQRKAIQLYNSSTTWNSEAEKKRVFDLANSRLNLYINQKPLTQDW